MFYVLFWSFDACSMHLFHESCAADGEIFSVKLLRSEHYIKVDEMMIHFTEIEHKTSHPWRMHMSTRRRNFGKRDHPLQFIDKKNHLWVQMTKRNTSAVAAVTPGDTWRHAAGEIGGTACRRTHWRHVPPPSIVVRRRQRPWPMPPHAPTAGWCSSWLRAMPPSSPAAGGSVYFPTGW
jgi:hypothetical protein